MDAKGVAVHSLDYREKQGIVLFDNPELNQNTVKVFWWRVRARLKKTFFGNSFIRVKWDKRTYKVRKEKRRIDPLMNGIF